MMRIVVITEEGFAKGEAAAVRQLLDQGADRVHLRKPGAAEADVRRLIESLPEEYYPRLTLHDRLPLAAEYGIGGVHLNSRNPEVPDGFDGLVSRSCHSLEEVAAHSREDYVFLSPIFDSISKSGYRSAFTREQLRVAAEEGIVGPRVAALGGVRPEHLPLLREWGFGGAALLGCVWSDASPEGIRRTMGEIRKLNNF